MGLIMGAIMSLAAALGAAVQQGDGAEGTEPMVLGIASIFIFPILYGIGGFIGGIISAAIYNVVAGVVGGLELDLQTPTSEQY